MQILAGIILLGVLIAFHELGHFLFAKMMGVRVLVFSLGFGPKIWGFKRGETEYRLSAIPLGGYVRMFGESLEEELTEAEKKMGFMHQPIWRKSLIAFAGPLFNFILPVILFFCLLLGVERVFAPTIGTVTKDGAAARAGLLPGDRISRVNGQEVESFNQLAEIISENPGQEVSLTVYRDIKKDTKKDIKNAVINLNIKPDIARPHSILEKDQAKGRIGVMPAFERALISVQDDSPLRDIGLKDFDEIISLDGRPIVSAHEIFDTKNSIKPGSKIVINRSIGHKEEYQELEFNIPQELIIKKHRDKSKIIHNFDSPDIPDSLRQKIDHTTSILLSERKLLESQFGLGRAKGVITVVSPGSVAEKIGLKSGDQILSIGGTRLSNMGQVEQAFMQDPRSPQVLGVLRKNGDLRVFLVKTPDDIADSINLNSDLAMVFGIKSTQVFKPGEIIERRVSIAEALSRAVEQTVAIGVLTAKSIWFLIKGDVPATQIGGPIMLFDVAQQAASKGLQYYIYIMCLLSVNLGLLNLLPIPALDGGHLLLFGIEAVQRKPLTIKTRAIATQIGIALLLLLMSFALFNDISRIFR